VITPHDYLPSQNGHYVSRAGGAGLPLTACPYSIDLHSSLALH
jgi:hypothetical protein